MNIAFVAFLFGTSPCLIADGARAVSRNHSQSPTRQSSGIFDTPQPGSNLAQSRNGIEAGSLGPIVGSIYFYGKRRLGAEAPAAKPSTSRIYSGNQRLSSSQSPPHSIYANVPDIKMEDDYHPGLTQRQTHLDPSAKHPHFVMAVVAQFFLCCSASRNFPASSHQLHDRGSSGDSCIVGCTAYDILRCECRISTRLALGMV